MTPHGRAKGPPGTRPTPPPPKRCRIDQLLVDRGLAPSRQRAQALIMAGKIRIDDQPVSKAGTRVAADAEVTAGEDLRYVGRGGLKLEAALDRFDIDPLGVAALDIGASTGGFTDCLLQHGAASVVALDVGYGQLDWKLRQDSRVRLMEKTNVRHVDPETFEKPFDLIVIDVSFISLRQVLPKAFSFLRPGGRIVALVKPQFEAGRRDVEKGGIVRDAAVRQRVNDEIRIFAEEKLGLIFKGLIPSPVHGAKGNRESLIALASADSPPADPLPDKRP